MACLYVEGNSLGHRASTTGVYSGLGANSYIEISAFLVFTIALAKHFSECVQAHFQLASRKMNWMIQDKKVNN